MTNRSFDCAPNTLLSIAAPAGQLREWARNVLSSTFRLLSEGGKLKLELRTSFSGQLRE
jgi:hypothetical protein